MAKAAPTRHLPSQDRARATREQILDTAARLFGERGIANTSTNRIAAEAQVSIGSVYRYFSDRDVLVDELLERMMTNIENRLAERIADIDRTPLRSVVTSILEAISAELAANAPLVRALADGLQFYSSGIPEFEPRIQLLIESLLTAILGTEHTDDYAMMAVVLVNTGFAAVLRTSAREIDTAKRQDVISVTAEMITAWIQAKHPERQRAMPASSPQNR